MSFEVNKLSLTNDQIDRRLIEEYKNGNIKAKDELILRYLDLIRRIAKDYSNRVMEIEDLIQEGSIGLLKAIDNFDASRENKFQTYAYSNIRNTIIRAIDNQSEFVRIPVYLQDSYRRLAKAKRELLENLKREPTIEELSLVSNLDIKTINKLSLYKTSVISYDEVIETEEGNGFESKLTNDYNLEEDIEDKMLKSLINNLIDDTNLTQRQKEILKVYFGIGCEKMSVKEIIENYHISKTRVFGLRDQALNNFRKSNKMDNFAVFMCYPDRALENLTNFRKAIQKKRK